MDKKQSNRNVLLFVISMIIIIGVTAFFLFQVNEKELLWNGVRSEIKEKVEVAQHDLTSLDFLLAKDSVSAHRKRSEEIMSKATVSELLKLTKHSSGTIRAIAYEGLIRRSEFEDKEKLILEAISDSVYFVGLDTGCESTDVTLGAYLIDYVLQLNNERPPFPIEKQDFGLTESQEKRILTVFRTKK